ncbi:MAG TPA: phosphoribosyl-AMP cyclohydrolase, partial [Actinomycetota bacterium]
MERVELDALTFDDRGLLPAIVQDAENDEVLMMAWMSRESVERTLDEGRTVFWSRSRNELWRKGETSGHIPSPWHEGHRDAAGIRGTA